MAARVLLLVTLLTGHAMLAMAIPQQALTSPSFRVRLENAPSLSAARSYKTSPTVT